MQQLSPETIENAQFTIGLRGYDKGEVDDFLRSLADELRDFMEHGPWAEVQDGQKETALEEQSLLAFGTNIGALMQEAHDLAESLRHDAEADSSAARRAAESEFERSKDEARRIIERAENDAAAMRREAEAEVSAARDRAARERQHAEAEARIYEQEARKAAREVKEEAAKKAAHKLGRADQEVAERLRDAERRLRRLQEHEAALQNRMRAMVERLRSLTADVQRAEARGSAPASGKQSGSGSPGRVIRVDESETGPAARRDRPN